MDEVIKTLSTKLLELQAAALDLMDELPTEKRQLQIVSETKNIYNICGYWNGMAVAALPSEAPVIPPVVVPVPAQEE